MDVQNVTVLWNGGWDELEVNLDDVRLQTQKEQVERLDDPFLNDGYLRSSFLKGELKNGETAVKILRKIASGD